MVSASIIIVGAGPFGLAVAAGLRAGDVRYRLLGEPMSFWRRHMPHGMVLRSASDWHLDPLGELTIERFLGEQATSPAAAEPLPIATYLAYAAWFQERAGIVCEPLRVRRLDLAADGRFRLVTDPPDPDGAEIVSDTVVLAVGQRTFAYVPPELAAILPPGRFEHTCDLVRFDQLRAKRVVIIGGRQGMLTPLAGPAIWTGCCACTVISSACSWSRHRCQRKCGQRLISYGWSPLDMVTARSPTN